MKTQINKLVNGNSTVVGTDNNIRLNIVDKVIRENPEYMKICLLGTEILLEAQYSLSRKSVNYSSIIDIELYKELIGNFGLPKKDPKAFITINGNCKVWLSTNSKKKIHNYIDNSHIEIL